MKKTKVLVLLGSPRKKGNSALLAEKIAKAAESEGAQIKTVSLHDMNIRPCTSCFKCQKPGSKSCSIRDDMDMLYPALIEADAWVIATPIYWFTMSAQTKIWMDRCFALPAYGVDPFAGKKIAVAMSYGGEDPYDSGCINAIRTFQDAYAFTRSKLVGFVYGSAMNAGEMKKNEKALKAALELGKKLVASED